MRSEPAQGQENCDLDEDCARPWYELERITTPGSYQLYPEE